MIVLIEWPGLCRRPVRLTPNSKLILITMAWWPSADEFAEQARVAHG